MVVIDVAAVNSHKLLPGVLLVSIHYIKLDILEKLYTFTDNLLICVYFLIIIIQRGVVNSIVNLSRRNLIPPMPLCTLPTHSAIILSGRYVVKSQRLRSV